MSIVGSVFMTMFVSNAFSVWCSNVCVYCLLLLSPLKVTLREKKAFQKAKHLYLWVLEHPQLCSIWDPEHSNQMKRSQHVLVWLRKMIFLLHICSVCRGHCLLQKSVINMIWLLLHVFDWPIRMISWFATGSSHLFAVHVPVWWARLQKNK